MAGTPIYLKDVVNLWKSVSDWVTGATVDTPKVQDDAVKAEIALMKTELAAIRAAQTDGSAKFTLSGNIAERAVYVSETIPLSVEPGQSVNIFLKAAGGCWATVHGFGLYVPAIAGSEGKHKIISILVADLSATSMSLTSGVALEGNSSANLNYPYYTTVSILQNLPINDSDGIIMNYRNDSNVAQNGSARLRVMMIERRVS